MKNCCASSNIKSVIFINPKDIKEISEENGLVLKRKYGKFDRKIYKFDTK